jgi:hypothetical protein
MGGAGLLSEGLAAAEVPAHDPVALDDPFERRGRRNALELESVSAFPGAHEPVVVGGQAC